MYVYSNQLTVMCTTREESTCRLISTGARRNVWKANLVGQTHTVIIVHTCGSYEVSIRSLKNVIDNFDLHIFQLT